MPPLYTFYGDDFTGSTDVLEQLAINGIASVLFLTLPTADELRRFSPIRAFGVAGDSRSRSPEWMSKHLPLIFQSLRSFQTPIVHYKVCSTFDSSPTHGSIGRAIELGIDAIDSAFVPIVVGAPHLRRFVHEGHLFAAAPDGEVHRIDRHPMSRHPVTPMREPDLHRHLAKQTSIPVGLVSHTDLHSFAAASYALQACLSSGDRAVLFDTVDSQSLSITGELLWSRAQERQLLCAGSSGLTTALISAWRSSGMIAQRPPSSLLTAASPLFVLSGSCSVATSRQIRWAAANGFHTIKVDPAKLLDPNSAEAYRASLLREASTHLSLMQDTVLYTALDDSPSTAAGEALGTALGSLLRQILIQTSVTRVVLCGGDTSSHAVQQLGISALTWVASMQPGAPLCRAHLADANARRLELVLKGGQVGTDDFFAAARGHN
jgi:uncharacterized protein YgbK (DUF1537 family)